MEKSKTKHTYVLGIDPGLTGALAWYDRGADYLYVEDMPVHQIKGKNHLDLYQLARFVDCKSTSIFKAIIERVHSMPKQGVASSFKFGEAFGAAKMVVAASFIPMVLVTPQAWKKHFKLTSDKDAARQKASELMPRHAHNWPLKKHDGRAEAALLAYYGSLDL